MTCSQTIKKCGLKSTRQVAELNGVTPRTVQYAFNDHRTQFKLYVYVAIEDVNQALRDQAESVLNKLQRG